MCFHAFSISSFVHRGAQAPSSARWDTAGCVFSHYMIRLMHSSPHDCDYLPFFFFLLFFLFFWRLENQLITDIQTILQLLQRQPTLGPPAYSTVTASPDYHRPAVKVQPVALTASHFFSHTGTQVRMCLFLFHTIRYFCTHCMFMDYCVIYGLHWHCASAGFYNHQSQSHSIISGVQWDNEAVSVVWQAPTVLYYFAPTCFDWLVCLPRCLHNVWTITGNNLSHSM